MHIEDIMSKVNGVTFELKEDGSSMISHIKWVPVDNQTGTLYITFKNNNSTYKYNHIAGVVFYDMISSESIGKFFCKTIKPTYAFEKVKSI